MLSYNYLTALKERRKRVSRRSNTNWASILGGIAELVIAGGAAYAIYKARESVIDQLLNLPTDKAVTLLLQMVPQLDEDSWDTFATHLRSKAETSLQALRLLLFAVEVRKVSQSIDYLLAKSLSQARAVLSSTVREMDDAEWVIFEYILGERAETNLTARALLNHAVDIRESGDHTEELFRASIEAALADDVITASEAFELEKLRKELSISPETARDILIEVQKARKSIDPTDTALALRQRNTSIESAQSSRKSEKLPTRQ